MMKFYCRMSIYEEWDEIQAKDPCRAAERYAEQERVKEECFIYVTREFGDMTFWHILDGRAEKCDPKVRRQILMAGGRRAEKCDRGVKRTGRPEKGAV